jgi:HAMP domain-containing protein
MSRPDSTHHHGILAGVSAGTAAVLVGGACLVAVWHRVAGPVGQALVVIVLAATAAVILAVIAAAFYAVLWLRHRVRNPELLAGRHAVRAEAVTARPEAPGLAWTAREIPADGPAAGIEPPREIHNHFHFDGPEAAIAAIRAVQGKEPGHDQ